MKRQLIYFIASALLMAGCSKEETGNGADGYGTLAIRTASDAWVETRTEVDDVPAGDDFKLRIMGEEYNQSWATVAEFTESETQLRRGDYNATITYGDPTIEGPGKPYYIGTAAFKILARQATSVEITAKLANAQALVRATEQFTKYFHDAKFTLTTGSGNKFEFTPGSLTPAEAVYVKAATRLSVVGTARRQSQTGEDEGAEIRFPEQTLAATVSRTRHTFTFDAQDAGSVTLTITLGDDFVETLEFPVELNDDAIPNVD